MSSKATSGNVRRYDVDANASIVECVLNPYEIIALLKVTAWYMYLGPDRRPRTKNAFSYLTRDQQIFASTRLANDDLQCTAGHCV